MAVIFHLFTGIVYLALFRISLRQYNIALLGPVVAFILFIPAILMFGLADVIPPEIEHGFEFQRYFKMYDFDDPNSPRFFDVHFWMGLFNAALGSTAILVNSDRIIEFGREHIVVATPVLFIVFLLFLWARSFYLSMNLFRLVVAVSAIRSAAENRLSITLRPVRYLSMFAALITATILIGTWILLAIMIEYARRFSY